MTDRTEIIARTAANEIRAAIDKMLMADPDLDVDAIEVRDDRGGWGGMRVRITITKEDSTETLTYNV